MLIFMSLVYHGLFRAPAKALGSPASAVRSHLIAREQLGVEGA
jgi:hypothetical protein